MMLIQLQGSTWHGRQGPTQFKARSRINCQGLPVPLQAILICSPLEDESKLRTGDEGNLDLAVSVSCYGALDDRQ